MQALKSPVNQTRKMVIKHVKKLGCFDTRKPCLNCSFQDDDQGFQNILAMCLLRPEQRNKLKNSNTCLFHQR